MNKLKTILLMFSFFKLLNLLEMFHQFIISCNYLLNLLKMIHLFSLILYIFVQSNYFFIFHILFNFLKSILTSKYELHSQLNQILLE